MRLQAFDAMQPAEKLWNAKIRQQFLIVERNALQRRHVRCRRRAHPVVEAGDQHPLIRRFERRQRPCEPPCRVGNHGRIGGMQVVRRAAHDQFDVADALCAAHDCWLFERIHAAGFPQAAVGAQQIGVALAEGFEIDRADLLFPFDQKIDAAGEGAIHRQPRLNRLDAQHQVAFIVGDAARIQFTVAQHRLEWRGMPQIERLRRLNVVVVVDQECALAAAEAGVHHRRSARHAKDVHLCADLFETLRDQRCCLFDADSLRCDRGLAQQRAEFIEVASLVFLNVRFEAIHGATPFKEPYPKV